MANEMPSSANYTGLSRKVLLYSERFTQIVNKIKKPGFSQADWGPLEELVDVKGFQRVGVFLTARVEVSNWQEYKGFITQYGGTTSWEGGRATSRLGADQYGLRTRRGGLTCRPH